jgi:ABC-2 type transport system permease protein
VSIVAYRVLVRTLLSRGRILWVLAAAMLLVAAGAVIGIDGGSAGAARGLVEGGGITILVPLVAVVFATAALGDHVDDGTLVYLWMRPVGRSSLALAAIAAALTAIVPLVVLPLVAVAVLAGGTGGLVLGALAAPVLASAAYGGLFVGLGLAVRRALLWGVLYVVIWEGVLAGVSARFAQLSVRAYAGSVLAGISDGPVPRGGAEPAVAALVLLALAAVGAVLTVVALRRAELHGS